MENTNNLETATFGTGCFWCTEPLFKKLKGVKSVISGYSGGHVENPTYEQICTKGTGHAEIVRITFDPSIISFEGLLDVFWRLHDPTTLNQQGNDKGPQYRSAIYYHDDKQKAIAEKSKEETDASDLWPNPIVTEIAPLINYYPAEDYHQEYYNRIGSQNPYCTFVIDPKVEKFMKEFKDQID